MYYLIQFILGILLGVFSVRISNLAEEMHNTANKNALAQLKHKLWGSVFGLSCMVIISSALLAGQLSDWEGKKIEGLYERVRSPLRSSHSGRKAVRPRRPGFSV